MRILIVTPAHEPSRGGIETVLADLEATWAALGHPVDVLVTSEPSRSQQDTDRRFAYLAALRRARQADIILCVNTTLRAWPVLLAFPGRVVLQHHSDYRFFASGFRTRAAVHLRLLLARHLAGIAVSPSVASSIGGSRCEVIPNPVELEAAPGKVQQRPIPMLFVGRLVAEKGLHTLLRALHHLGSEAGVAQLVVAGDGPLRDELTALACNLGLDVDWRGALPRAEVRQLMRCSERLIVPSHYEPFGVVALEGAVEGCALYLSDVGGLRDYFHTVATYHKPGDAVQLAEQLLAPPLNAHLPDGFVQQFDLQTVAARYLSSFRQRQRRGVLVA